jgi:hypothetical protein
MSKSFPSRKFAKMSNNLYTLFLLLPLARATKWILATKQQFVVTAFGGIVIHFFPAILLL